MRFFSILGQMKNTVRIEYTPRKNVWFCFSSIVWVRFSHKTEKFQFWKSLRYFNIFWSRKIYSVRFEYAPLKNIWFGFISIVWVYFSHKIQKIWFWKSWKYFDVVLDLNFSHRKISDFVSFPLLGFTLVIKLINFNFKGH